MSWLSEATGIHLGNIGAPVGAAIGSFIPGVGTAIGAGLGGALGSLGQGKSVGQSVLNGAATYGAGKLAGAIPGLSGVLGSAASGAGGVLSSALGGLTGGGSSGGSGGGGINPAILALAAAQTANAANLGKTANDYSDKAWNLSNDSYTSRAGLRSAGIAGLTNNKAPDLSSLSAIRAQNPIAARAGVTGAPSPAPGMPAPPSDIHPSIPAGGNIGSPAAPSGGMLRQLLEPPTGTPINGDVPARGLGPTAPPSDQLTNGQGLGGFGGLRAAFARPNVNRISSDLSMAA